MPADANAAATWTAATTKISVFTYASQADTRYKQELYHHTATTFDGATSATFTNAIAIALTGAATIPNYTSQNVLININASGGGTFTANDIIHYTLPTGTLVGSTAAMTDVSTDDVFSTVNRITSPTRLFKWPSIAIKSTTAGANGIKNAAGKDRVLTGITSRDANYAASILTASEERAVVTGGGGATACDLGDIDVKWTTDLKLNVATMEFSNRGITPTAVNKRTSLKVYYPITITATTTVPSLEGAQFDLALESTWAFSTSTVCSVSGLSATVAGTGPTVSQPKSGQTLSITSFGNFGTDTFTISCSYVLGTNTASASITLVNTLTLKDAAAGNLINTWASAGNPTVTVTTATDTAGVSKDWSYTLIPNNASAGTADADFSFKVDRELPMGSTVQIKFPTNLGVALAQGDINNSCWSMLKYQTCKINSSSELELVMAVDVAADTLIDLYVNKGYTLPTNVNISTDVFKVSASYAAQTLVTDAATLVSTKQFTAAAAIAGTLSGQVFAMSNKNAGEYADYTFTFKSTTGYTATDKIVIYFPVEFDPFVGHASQWLDNESGTYFMKCSSSAMGLSWCTVNKWKVTIVGTTPVDAGVDIDITLHYVSNPAAGSTS